MAWEFTKEGNVWYAECYSCAGNSIILGPFKYRHTAVWAARAAESGEYGDEVRERLSAI